ncbi:MAG: peptidylprolyl isomerase [bacterium]|nr:peptidylprolyl isomerase [bacterium]
MHDSPIGAVRETARHRRRALAAGLLLLALLAPAARGEIKEQIVAIVGDEIITYSELERILAPVFEQYERLHSGAELFSMLQKARREILEQIIEERLVLQEARRRDIRAQMGDEFAREVDRVIAEVRRRFPSEEEFVRRLEREGTTLERFRAEQEDRTLVRAMLMKDVSSKCTVSPAEVRRYYETHKTEFEEPERIHVSQIWMKEDPQRLGRAEERAREALGMIEAGRPFADVAREHSDCPYAARGGDWGFISRGHWTRELEDAAFALEPGTHSGLVRSNLGCHIIKVHERRHASFKPLDGVYAEIEKRLFAEKIEARRVEYVERLRRRTYISVVK